MLTGPASLHLPHAHRRTRIVSAAAGAAHSVALASDGSLYTWGDGSYGQLGHEQLQVMAAPHSHNTLILPLPQKVASLNPATLAPESRCEAGRGQSLKAEAVAAGWVDNCDTV